MLFRLFVLLGVLGLAGCATDTGPATTAPEGDAAPERKLVEVEEEAPKNNAQLPAETFRGKLFPDNHRFVSSRDGLIYGEVENLTDKPVKVNFDMLNDPVIALDVYDAQGNRMHAVAPSLTGKAMERLITLPPKGRQVFEYSTNIFEPPLKPGRYTAKMTIMPSNTVHFEIKGGAPAKSATQSNTP